MYGKMFASTYTGSMAGSGADVFSVWGWIIANACNGSVEVNPKLLAAMIGISPERVQSALDYLSSPDVYSRSQSEEGRRIVQDGMFQWRVVNHITYRKIQKPEELREYNREAKRRSRKRQAMSNRESSKSRHTEAEAEAEAEAISPLTPKGEPASRAPASKEGATKPKRSEAWRNSPHYDDACTALDHLNAKRAELSPKSRGFGRSRANLKGLIARLGDGDTDIAQILAVIDARASQARLEPDELEWLTPVTPFRDSTWGRSLALVAKHNTGEKEESMTQTQAEEYETANSAPPNGWRYTATGGVEECW